MHLKKLACFTFIIFICAAYVSINYFVKSDKQVPLLFSSNFSSAQIKYKLDKLSIVEDINKSESKTSINSNFLIYSKNSEYLLDVESSFIDSFENETSVTQQIELQKELIRLKKSLKQKTLNIEKWNILIVYYFYIEEKLSLEEINKLNPSIINFKKIDSLVNSPYFYERIHQYKGIETEKEMIKKEENIARAISTEE